MAYREAERERGEHVEVIRHQPMNRGAMAILVLLFLGISTILLFQALTYVRSTRFDCVRGGVNTCTVRRDYLLLTTEQRLPIHHIHQLQISSHSSKSATKYGVRVLLKDGEGVALIRPTSRATAELVKSGIELVALDPRPGSSGLPLQDRSRFAALFFLVVGLGFGALVLLVMQWARLEFDFRRGTIKHTLFRFPLRPTRRVFRLEEVKRARVIASAGSRGSVSYETALVLDQGPDFVILSIGGGDEARNEASVAQINSMLAKMREQDSAAE